MSALTLLAVSVISAAVGFNAASWMKGSSASPTPVATGSASPDKPTANATEALWHPKLAPYKTHMLQVSPTHRIHVEETGNPNGFPVFYLHGGPAAGLSDEYHQFFDPQFFRVIGFEQRGCGRSTPLGELNENTTWDLVEDIQTIRKTLGIDKQKYLLWGGSWGSLLALASAQKHPEDVAGVIVRGISLGRPGDTAWSSSPGNGLFNMYPETGDYLKKILAYGQPDPEDIRQKRDPILGIFDRLFNDPNLSEAKRREVLQIWRLGNTYTSGERLAKKAQVVHDPDYEEHLASAKIVCRYYYQNAFMNPPDQLIQDVGRMKGIPFIFIVNGREDINTPAKRAYDLHNALQAAGVKQAQLAIVEDAGHSAGNPNTLPRLMKALDDFKAMQQTTK